MDSPSEKEPAQSTERERKAQSLNVISHNQSYDQFSAPISPNSLKKSRPISMFVHPQEKLSNKTSEITNNNNFNAMPPPENTTPPSSMTFSFALATNSEVDVASVNSFRTMDTNTSYTGDQESLSSDVTERANGLQGIIKMLCELDVNKNFHTRK